MRASLDVKHLYRFETKYEPLASRAEFAQRLVRNVLVALAVTILSLAIGTAGYVMLESMSLIDGFLNASMILSTMGPVSVLTTTGGKIFASLYAIASGLLLFALAGLILTPVYHRMIHHFHLEEEKGEQRQKKRSRR